MSGRGRGRGSANKTPIPASSIGISRNELNQNILTPPELYPATFFRTIKIEPEDVDLFLVGVKQQLRMEFKNSQYFIKEKNDLQTIERYSDKYETILNQPSNENRIWNYKLFPDELKPRLKSKTKEMAKTSKKVTFDELKTKLEKLENNEKEDENIEDEEKDNEEIETEMVEEDIEEETDYAMSYFDNGEDFLNESDDNLGDEATF